MIGARRLWLLGLLGADGCGGIAIVSGDPFVADAGPAVAPRDAGAPDAEISLDAVDSAVTVDVAAIDRVPLDPFDVPVRDLDRPEVVAADGVASIDVAAAADAAPCAICARGTGSALACCDGACRDLRSDRAHCGACGAACARGDECVAGLCVALPDAGLPDVALPDAGLPDVALPDAGLPDVALPDAGLPDAGLPDVALLDARLPDAALSDVGSFEVSVLDAILVNPTACAVGEIVCGGRCVDMTSDRFHCGGCGVVCSGALGCLAGLCVGRDGGVE